MFDVATRKRVFWKLVAMLDTLPFRSSTIGMMVFFFSQFGDRLSSDNDVAGAA